MTTDHNKHVDKKKKKRRCFSCKRKLKVLSGYSCLCSMEFCSSHRLPFDHDCTFDWKKKHQDQIRSRNPTIDRIKMENI